MHRHPLEYLPMCFGSLVTLIRNLNVEKGVYNGTRLIVQETYSNFSKADILTTTYKGEQSFYFEDTSYLVVYTELFN